MTNKLSMRAFSVIVQFLKPRFVRSSILPIALSASAIAQNFRPEDESSNISILSLKNSTRSNMTFRNLAKEISSRTSLSMSGSVKTTDLNSLSDGWLWIQSSEIEKKSFEMIAESVRRGLLLIVEGILSDRLQQSLQNYFPKGFRASKIQNLAIDHTLMRSFHLLKRLPTCKEETWKELYYDGRTAVIAIPFNFLGSLSDSPLTAECNKDVGLEERRRIFINLLMYALTMDYKNDQIHLPEILKRIR